MTRDDLFIGLPAEFAPPEKAAEHLAALATRAEREAYWLRIPEGWRFMIGHFAAIEIALAIVELKDLDARRGALEEVPGIMRKEVEWRITHLWRSYDVRAEYQAELAAERLAKEMA